ncbi:MAG: hypothetical protein HY907_06090 [Deltaproteobacteria bacterium]|nr:hypothetical protein [Deltaproteobacteria bacterium]
MEHRLHQVIGDIVQEAAKGLSGVRPLLDPACGVPKAGHHNLPLFLSEEPSNATEICNVDAVILVGNRVEDYRIKVVVEIEEADVGPTKICGKFLTTTLAKYLIHEKLGDRPVPFDAAATFVQVLDTSGLKLGRSAKPRQWKNIEDAIKAAIRDTPLVKATGVTGYMLVHGNKDDFGRNGAKRRELMEFLRQAVER